ncbi:hypothetical protein BVC80_157g171 [Macleaya cordata]|uniref:OVATE domain-containing protein n=1 Tax=Macleaya cordata TaxID=56857 RepID=A0A200RCB7_MACCD|nr:hypothetical protein BVC80_157g171 [Macleaya cordata]
MIKEESVYNGGSFMNKTFSNNQSKREEEKKREKVREVSHYYLVAKKLRELELMDMSDMEHVLDVEEVIHYYSRLTCPVYLDIFDKFFMQMYSEFFLLHKH